MKRAAFIVAGALLSFILGMALLALVAHWGSSYFVTSEDDVGRNIWILVLIIWPSLLVLGGIMGNRIYRKNLARRSSKRS